MSSHLYWKPVRSCISYWRECQIFCCSRQSTVMTVVMQCNDGTTFEPSNRENGAPCLWKRVDRRFVFTQTGTSAGESFQKGPVRGSHFWPDRFLLPPLLIPAVQPCGFRCLPPRDRKKRDESERREEASADTSLIVCLFEELVLTSSVKNETN